MWAKALNEVCDQYIALLNGDVAKVRSLDVLSLYGKVHLPSCSNSINWWMEYTFSSDTTLDVWQGQAVATWLANASLQNRNTLVDGIFMIGSGNVSQQPVILAQIPLLTVLASSLHCHVISVLRMDIIKRSFWSFPKYWKR